MNSTQLASALLESKGHTVKLREYVKPCNGRVVYYITEINGKKYYTNQQFEAHRDLKKLLEAEGINEQY